MDFAKSTFLVAGGGSGLGAATAKLFAEQGANVVLADINADAIAALAGQIGPHAAFIR
ncbi:MAG: SDR family NAD(P)-dependent oxidoreductase, partial [Rhodocyclaceae bacterium]|nr:SDR family NAD(P)-dependent oxidoreductase [Rhodocyclaceae bacterium]